MVDLMDYTPASELIKKKCEAIMGLMIDERCSVRKAEEELLIPRSTIHRYIHTHIRQHYPDKYRQIQHILRENLNRQLRG